MTSLTTRIPQPIDPFSAALERDHPGRWVGGAIGALASLAAAVAANIVSGPDGILGWDDWSIIGLLGIPIAFCLGRELSPLARSGGWGRAFSVGMLFGWVAPPLGAVEILAGSRLLELGNLSSSMAGPVTLILVPVAIPISFIAIFVTLPVGIAWGIVARLVPDRALTRLRVPVPLDRLGVRHALVLAGLGLLLVELTARS